MSNFVEEEQDTETITAVNNDEKKLQISPQNIPNMWQYSTLYFCKITVV